MKNHKIAVLLIVAGLCFSSQIHAANCGDTNSDGVTDTVCACGDTVVGAAGYTYELTGDLTCSATGLIVGSNDITIDGNGYIMTGSGGFSGNGISNSGGYDNITVENFGGIINFYYGVSFINSANSVVRDNNISLSSGFAIAHVTGSSIEISGNVLNFNKYGISMVSSTGSEVTGNIIFMSIIDISNIGTGSIFGNNFISHNDSSKMISSFAETSTVGPKNVGDEISFTFTSKKIDNTACVDCATVITFPGESSLIYSDNGSGVITGGFVPTKSGTYSLVVQISDENGNISKKRYSFLVGDTQTEITKYYFYGETMPTTHGQIYGHDLGVLLLNEPAISDSLWCGYEVLASPDEMPNYPVSYLTDVNVNAWYKLGSLDDEYISLQNVVCTAREREADDFSVDVPTAAKYTWISRSFSDINWIMDQPYRWYFKAVKLYGSSPVLITFPAAEGDTDPASWAVHHHGDGSTDASYAEFVRRYSVTPVVKSLSNEEIVVLSATEPVDEPGSATIVLDGTGATDTTTDIVFGNYNRPFAGYVTTISSDGTATLHATGVDEEVTINSVNMEITPDSGSVDVQIALWNPYYSVWTEDASEEGITATHVIGGLMPNIYYEIRKNGVSIGSYLSDANGEITFSCVAGSIFTIEGIVTIDETDGDNEDDNEKHCFIATAAYGTSMAEEVRVLRNFRNEYLLSNPLGKAFVHVYYKISPPVAKFIKENAVLKDAVKKILTLLLWISEKATE